MKQQFEDECRRANRPIPESEAAYFGFTSKKIDGEVSLFNSMKGDKNHKANEWHRWKEADTRKRKFQKRPHSIGYIGSQEISSDEPEPLTYTSEEEKAYVPAKYLYDKQLECKKSHPLQTIDLNSLYLTLCLKYLGYRDLEEFLKDSTSLTEEDREIQGEVKYMAKDRISNLAVNFKCYYFTQRNDYTREIFSLALDFKNRHEEKSFRAELKDFHRTTAGPNKKEKDPVIYEGTAVEGATFVNLQLREKINDRPLSVFCHKKFMPIEDIKWMYATAAGVSSEGMPITLEAILVREDQNIKEAEPFIDAYLQLRRNNTRLPGELFAAPREIKVPPSGIAVKELMPLPGTYRVWNFRWGHSERRGIMQSKLTILENFKISIETVYEVTLSGKEEERRKQHVVMSVSHVRDRRRKLCLASHTPISDGMEVITYAILDIDRGTEVHQISKGIFCGQRGYREENKDTTMAAEPLVFMKEDPDAEFEAKHLNAKTINHMIAPEGSPYREMLRQLFDSYGLETGTTNKPEMASDEKKGKRERFLNTLKGLYRETLGST